MFPNKRNVVPRYDQLTLNLEDRKNKFQQILSPNPEDAGVWIHQDAWFHLGQFEQGKNTTYRIKKSGNGVYAFVLSGDATIHGQALHARDGLGIWNSDAIDIIADTQTELLLMEVPMSLG